MDNLHLNGEKLNVKKLLSEVSLTDCLDISRMRVTRVRALRDEALYDVFGGLYEMFEGKVVPRLEGKGIVLVGIFSYHDKNSTGVSSPAPLGMIMSPHSLGINRTVHLESPHYVRFNTEFCMRVPPARNYTGLDELMDAYVSEVDPDFRKEARVSRFKEWEARDRGYSAHV